MVKRNNRTKLATILTAAMIMGTLPGQAFADSADSGGSSPATGSEAAVQSGTNAQITKVKAEALARQYVNIPKEYALQGISFSSEQLAAGKRNTWGLDFVKKVNGKQQGSIYVRIHADSGQLLEFRTYVDNPSAKPTYPLKVERDAAQKLALEFIHTMAPNYESQVKLNTEYGVSLLPPLTGQVRHPLRFDRIVNGIPYADNYIEVEIDSEGHMMSYSLRWDETIVFPKPGTTLAPEQADAKLRAAAKPELSYIIPYNAKGVRKPVLSYKLESLAIDAESGELKDRASTPYFNRQGTVSETPLSTMPDGAVPAKGDVTEQQATELVKAAFKLPTEAMLSHSNYNENIDEYTGKTYASWDLNWTITKNGKEQGFLSASVDGHTGVIRNFYDYNYSGSAEQVAEDKAGVTLQQAMELATATVKKQLPWLTHQFYLVKPDPEQYEGKTANEIGSYRIEFVRKIHGATVDYDTVGVSIDVRTGEVTDYSGYIADFDYPATPPSVITKDQAVTKWLGYYRTELAYRLVQQYWWDGQPIPIEKANLLIASGEAAETQLSSKNEAELVYRLVPRPLDESIFLDAQSGSWRNRETGEQTQLEKPQALDIEGHWAQRQLELMVAYRALDVKDGKVRPSEQVTRGELIKMLVLARNSGNSPMMNDGVTASQEKASFDDVAADSSYFVYVESALAQNLIDIGDGSFNPDGKVSRDEMAELIVRALGYNALAEYEHIFKASFKDTDQIENKGQAAIVVGLKIMSLSDGKFLPKKQVTRAEASVAFFRYLQTRAELAEAPLRM
ncbi:S-layer homology domain-containing protein [Paenibacillus harenae]|uniref:SLH domain-containing protein n=1 Tax=Paenibacillus harenae TaxID=306543 RepID=A0ABT9U1R5_PAEHA|nr:S-layer homology domain-containing protein [Paenibacillus harenae]MDQ0113563.1 hypothetical protein [Paenibacillus harenae]